MKFNLEKQKKKSTLSSLNQNLRLFYLKSSLRFLKFRVPSNNFLFELYLQDLRDAKKNHLSFKKIKILYIYKVFKSSKIKRELFNYYFFLFSSLLDKILLKNFYTTNIYFNLHFEYLFKFIIKTKGRFLRYLTIKNKYKYYRRKRTYKRKRNRFLNKKKKLYFFSTNKRFNWFLAKKQYQNFKVEKFCFFTLILQKHSYFNASLFYFRYFKFNSLLILQKFISLNFKFFFNYILKKNLKVFNILKHKNFDLCLNIFKFRYSNFYNFTKKLNLNLKKKKIVVCSFVFTKSNVYCIVRDLKTGCILFNYSGGQLGFKGLKRGNAFKAGEDLLYNVLCFLNDLNIRDLILDLRGLKYIFILRRFTMNIRYYKFKIHKIHYHFIKAHNGCRPNKIRRN